MRPVSTRFEKTLASASFLAAVGFGATSLAISPSHDIAAGVLMAMAQFLLLTASILHIDYKLYTYGSSNKTDTPRPPQQQPA